jgi:hypothetical protein
MRLSIVKVSARVPQPGMKDSHHSITTDLFPLPNRAPRRNRRERRTCTNNRHGVGYEDTHDLPRPQNMTEMMGGDLNACDLAERSIPMFVAPPRCKTDLIRCQDLEQQTHPTPERSSQQASFAQAATNSAHVVERVGRQKERPFVAEALLD